MYLNYTISVYEESISEQF